MSDVSGGVPQLLGAWSRLLFSGGRQDVEHVISDEDPDFPHEDDCRGTDCAECGCCAHCLPDCPCPGCSDEMCLCSIDKDDDGN